MTTQRATEIGEFLLGTCRSLADACEHVAGCDPEELVTEELEEIDSIAMQCEACGWYCDPAEFDLAQTCRDCRE